MYCAPRTDEAYRRLCSPLVASDRLGTLYSVSQVPAPVRAPERTPQELAPAPDDVVVVRNLSKAFERPYEQVHTLKERAMRPFRHRDVQRLQALRDVSFSVARGEFFGIVGPNGSGKSTLLKCLAGIYRTDRGEIEVAGRM